MNADHKKVTAFGECRNVVCCDMLGEQLHFADLVMLKTVILIASFDCIECLEVATTRQIVTKIPHSFLNQYAILF